MTIVKDLIDEQASLASLRAPWEDYWRDVARFVLPAHEDFDPVTLTAAAAVNGVVGEPNSARKSKDLYDMTSLQGIERLTAGLISLKTPETENWHGLNVERVFGGTPNHAETVALENVRDYLFRVRANPKSGFWNAHKAALRSMCAFGDGWLFIKDSPGGGARVPFTYQYLPLNELYPGVDDAGQSNRMYRVFRRSAEQAYRLFEGKVPPKVQEMANDRQKMHQMVTIMHAVRPRDDMSRAGPGLRGAQFASFYAFPDDDFLVGESGYWEFPFARYAWSNSGARPFSEGPVAYALGELKSLDNMAMNELIASGQHLRPPLGIAGNKALRLNLNPGATNPGLITPDGKPLFAAITSNQRPDFANAVLTARRNAVREMLYLNLWQVLLNQPEKTATEAMILAQEKGDLFGPVGMSLNNGLSAIVDREIGILGRRNAFASGEALELPKEVYGQSVQPIFTSPLDRLRRMGELVGIQRLVEILGSLAQFKPGIIERLDEHEIADAAQEILGAPARVLRDRKVVEANGQQGQQMQQALAALAAMKGGGEAAQAVGAGVQSLAAGADTLKNSQSLRGMADLASAAGGTPRQAA